MLDIKYIREHKDEVQANSTNRLAKVDIDAPIKLDEFLEICLEAMKARAGEFGL